MSLFFNFNITEGMPEIIDKRVRAGKNKLVGFAPGFAIDLVDLIEQNRRHCNVMSRILRLRID